MSNKIVIHNRQKIVFFPREKNITGYITNAFFFLTNILDIFNDRELTINVNFISLHISERISISS